jgi:hypothetical protein
MLAFPTDAQLDNVRSRLASVRVRANRTTTIETQLADGLIRRAE